MERSVVENTLVAGAARVKRVREEATDTDVRLAEALAIVEDLRLRASVSETPVAAERLIDAQMYADALMNNREALAASLVELRKSQDKLLDQLPKRTP